MKEEGMDVSWGRRAWNLVEEEGMDVSWGKTA
jgi:hypothetical protein